MELELNSLDWNENELEHELELEDMKRTDEMMSGLPSLHVLALHSTKAGGDQSCQS